MTRGSKQDKFPRRLRQSMDLRQRDTRPGTCEQTLEVRSNGHRALCSYCPRVPSLWMPCAEACESKSRYRPPSRFKGHLASPSALVGVSSFSITVSLLFITCAASCDHDQDALRSLHSFAPMHAFVPNLAVAPILPRSPRLTDTLAS